MRAAVFYGNREIRVEERHVRDLKPNEILIDVKAAGICGTDIHIFQGGQGATECNPPVVLGHELAGVVSKIGSDVTRISVGDRVCADPNVMCGACSHCHKGEVQFCEDMYATGVDYDGGFGEQCIVLEKQAFKLEDHVSFEEGAMAEPLACSLHGIDLAGVKMGDEVLIIGGGTIGLTMVQLCKLSGAVSIAVSEPDAPRRELAKELGADIAVNPLEEDVTEVLVQNGMEHVNVIIECAGRVNTMEDAIHYAGRGATVMLFGLCNPEDIMQIKPFDEIFRKELTIRGSYVNPLTQGRAVDLLNNRKLDMKKLIAETLPLEGLQGALEVPSHAGKVIICP